MSADKNSQGGETDPKGIERHMQMSMLKNKNLNR